MTAAISVSGLRKSYGEVKAVDGVDFVVDAGQVFGLVGPNGAGKTTIVEILEGLRQPDSGQVTVLDMDLLTAKSRIKDRIGVQLQSSSLYPDLTVAETVALFASFFSRSLAVETVLEKVELADRNKVLTKTLSGGQRQRLSVALALVNDPDLIFLDEPTTGLDPQARHALWSVIENLQEMGKTILLTTHHMEEAERLCDRVAILDYGHILALDTPEALIKAHFEESAVQFEVDERLPDALFEDLPGVRGFLCEGKEVSLYSCDVHATLVALLALAKDRELTLDDIHIRRATLEDVFLRLTGRRIRE